jgi:hypothetical protein
MRVHYLPSNFGFLFSRKATTPSLKSSPASALARGTGKSNLIGERHMASPNGHSFMILIARGAFGKILSE